MAHLFKRYVRVSTRMNSSSTYGRILTMTNSKWLYNNNSSGNNNCYFSSAASNNNNHHVPIVLPNLGDSISEGQIVEFCKNLGDRVCIDDVVAIVETDKVSVDVRSDVDGVVTSVDATEGESVPVGETLMTIDSAGAHQSANTDNVASNSENKKTQENNEGTTVVVGVPSLGDSISEAEVSVILRSQGMSVDADEVVIVLETDKVSVDVRSPEGGVVNLVNVSEGDVVSIDQPLFEVAVGSTPKKPESTSATAASNSVPVDTSISSGEGRQPLIRFRHGSANAKRDAASTPTATQSSVLLSDDVPLVTVEVPPSHELFVVPERFRRAPLTDAQIEAIESGFYMES